MFGGAAGRWFLWSVLGANLGCSSAIFLVFVVRVFYFFCGRFFLNAERLGIEGFRPPSSTVCLTGRLPVEEVANHANLDHGMFVQFCDTAIMCLLSPAQPVSVQH